METDYPFHYKNKADAGGTRRRPGKPPKIGSIIIAVFPSLSIGKAGARSGIRRRKGEFRRALAANRPQANFFVPICRFSPLFSGGEQKENKKIAKTPRFCYLHRCGKVVV